MIKLLLFMFLPFLGEGLILTHGTEDQCRKLLAEAYNKLEALEQDNSKQAQLLEYKTTTYYKVPGESQLRSTAITSKLISSGEYVLLENPEAKVVKDKKTTVAILKGQQQILISDTTPGTITSAQLQALRDLIWKEARVVGCTLHAGDIREISFDLPNDLIARYQLTSVTFWVNQKQRQVKKVELRYIAGQPTERQVVEFLKQGLYEEEHPFKAKQPLGLVYDGKGKLHASYQKYKIIDVRNK